MATSYIDSQRAFIRKEYTYTYTVGSDSRYSLTAANFKVNAISGYTPVAVFKAYSGNARVNVRGFNATTSGTVLIVYNKAGSDVSGSITASIGILWMRNGLIS